MDPLPNKQDPVGQDLAHVWHPFTDQELWEKEAPIVIRRGKGSWLFDTEDQCYLDANSSIWTNVHGHCHSHLTTAIQQQAATLCHSSYLGLANDRASELAAKLCAFFPNDALPRCFFSDDGSTALEVAFKMSLQSRQQNHQPEKTAIIAFENAYHGDTLGAASVGGVSRFIKGYAEAGLEVCRVSSLDDLLALPEVIVNATSALVIEPLIQGVNQMSLWPAGMLARLRQWTHANDIHLILDEVMTGFGRTGKMFACQHEDVIPDFLCLAKGLTGGTMPLAATLTTAAIYESFKGPGRTFYYGHSYTGNALGCAAALANLEIFEKENTLADIERKGERLQKGLSTISPLTGLRRIGLILAFEVPSNGNAGKAGASFCQKLRQHHILTRPILNTIVIMPPLSITDQEITHLIKGINAATLPK